MKRGDITEFEALCAQIEAPLLGYAAKMLDGNTSEAEEIAQEALFRAYQALRAGRIKGALRPYVFSVAHNLAMDAARRTRRAAPLDGSVIVPWTPAAHAERPAERALLREQIDKALATLPASQRSALMLREFGGLRYDEIAETLDASIEQVKVWIYRARKRLAEVLDQDGQYVGEQHHGG